ncbi:MAM and LDL-receptor class A domain-containing protein 1-like [Eriocheir sinensis]|uniref:MAM and LDL-receptor class A domain-containing protein 1-like n=1 Tax=Eriocheir sinensis TaxID=95602 RepID=UPI0021C58757|nr:MAM and LDL-receptor class A domain-containing protein 1-like [Eriocheir sinensis]
MTPWIRPLLCLLLGVVVWPTSVISQECSFNEEDGEVTTCDLVMDAAPFHRSSWRAGRGSTYLWQGGPKTDAQGSTTGGYGMANVADMAGKEAWMTTRPGESTGPEGRCISFSFSMGQLGVDFLEVLLVSYDNENPEEALSNSSIPLHYRLTTLWRRRQTTSGLWEAAQITYSTQEQHSIAFSASPDPHFIKYRGFVAVDDIAFNVGPCENECLFDKDLCDWKNTNDEDDFDWSLGWSSDKLGTGPAKDQASSIDPRITTGGYAYIDSAAPRLSGDIARLVSEVLQPREQPFCLKFWVNMHGGGLGSLRYRRPWLNSRTLGEKTQLDFWYLCQQTVASDQESQVVFEASVGLTGAGDISLDSFRVTDGPCPSQPVGTSRSWGDCTFRAGTCKWYIPARSPYDCSFLSRVAGTHYDPPGHTESWYHFTDMYMKFDLNCYTIQPRESAAMVSPELKLTEASCLSFWVFMFTNVATQIHVGALKVVLVYGERNETVWRLQNQQHSHWHYAQVLLPVSPDPVQVAIVGVQGPKVTGMIGVDDITVFPSSQCPVLPSSASVEKQDCTFDHNFCLWKVEGESAGRVTTDTWHLPTDNRVLKDHTFNADGGGFVYLFSFRSKKESRITSPKIDGNSAYCLTFWFSEIYEDEDAKLSIFRVRDGEDDEEVVWSVKQKHLTDPPVSDQRAEWRYAQVLLEPQSSEYELVVEGKVYDSSWALDDITFIPDRDNCKLIPAKDKDDEDTEDD